MLNVGVPADDGASRRRMLRYAGGRGFIGRGAEIVWIGWIKRGLG